MRLIKQVVEIGNGAAVYVPREYIGKEVVIIFPEGIESVKKRILSKLIEFMPNVLGVYLYGSYARGEQDKDSDIDILVITDKKDEKMNKVFDDIDMRIMTLENAKKSIAELPGLIMPILNEASVILNPLLLEELKKYKINYKKFKWNFDDTKRIIKIIEDFAKLDKKNISASHVYSLIMRIRVLNMIEGLIKNKKYSNSVVFEMLERNGLKEDEIERYFEIYKKIRNDEEVREKIGEEEILKLVDILKIYLKKVENEAGKKT